MNREKIIKEIIRRLSYDVTSFDNYYNFLNNQISLEEVLNYQKSDKSFGLSHEEIKSFLDSLDEDEKLRGLVILLISKPMEVLRYMDITYDKDDEIYKELDKKIDLEKLITNILNFESIHYSFKFIISNYLKKTNMYDYLGLENIDDDKLNENSKLIKYLYLLKYYPGIALKYINQIENTIFEFGKKYIIENGVNKNKTKERDFLVDFINIDDNRSKLQKFLEGNRGKREEIETVYKNIFEYGINNEDDDEVFNKIIEIAINYSTVAKKIMIVLTINDYVYQTDFRLLDTYSKMKKNINKADLVINYFNILKLQAIYYYDYFCSQIPKGDVREFLLKIIRERVEFVKEGSTGKLQPTPQGKQDFDYLEKTLVPHKFSYFNSLYLEVTGTSYNNKNIKEFEDTLKNHMIKQFMMEESEVDTIIDYIIRDIGTYEEIEVKTYDRPKYYQFSYISSRTVLCEEVEKEDFDVFSRYARVFANKIFKSIFHTLNYQKVRTMKFDSLDKYGFTEAEKVSLALPMVNMYYGENALTYIKSKKMEDLYPYINENLSLYEIESKEVIYKELFDGKEYKEFFLENIGSSKRLREIFIEKIKDEDIYEFAKENFSNKKSECRSNLIDLLINSGNEEKNLEIFKEHLKIEKAKTNKEKIENYIKSVNALKTKREEIKDYLHFYNENLSNKIEKAYGKLPLLKDNNGKELSLKYSEILISLYIDFDFSLAYKLNTEMNKFLDENSVEDLAYYIYSVFKSSKFNNKIFDYAKGSFVNIGSVGVEEIKKDIITLSKGTKGLLASKIVEVIIYNKDETILSFIDYLIRKVKHKTVNDQAISSFEKIAELENITLEDLQDKIIPNFSLNIRGEKIYSYGKREFKITLLPNGVFEILNLDSGKVVKSLPKENGSEDVEVVKKIKEEFKILKKQIKETYKLQIERLENTLGKPRYWTGDKFIKTFVNNPIMREFSISQIWARYEEGEVIETFRYSGDGSFINHNGDEIDIKNYIDIGLLHPVEVEEDILEYWREDLEDYEITQVFEQLNREVSLEKLNVTFEKVKAEKLNYGLLKEGWKRGEVLDGGVFYGFYLEDKSTNIGVELYHEGIPVGWYENEEVKLESLKFYNLDKIGKNNYGYDSIKENITLDLDQIPKRFYSEVIRSLKRYL